MKIYKAIYACPALLLSALMACSPDETVIPDNSVIDLGRIDRAELIASHNMLLADGKAQIELYPRLYTADNNLIPDARIPAEWLEYTSDSGLEMQRMVSTDNSSLIGSTISASFRIKGTDIVSNTVTFTVIDPKADQYATDITIPVVFHVIQTTDDIESYGGSYKAEQIDQVLRKLNHMLCGDISTNAVGVDTHIRLVPAVYNPDGDKLLEPGINRYTSSKIDATGNYEDFLSENHLIWPAEHYMNIWLISDRAADSGTFGVSNLCTPRYTEPGATDMPDGLTLTPYDGRQLLAREVGLLYKIQELDNIDRDFMVAAHEMGYNELGFYLGRYLGLLPTCNYFSSEIGTDYCDDTIDYFADSNAPGSNMTWYKESQGCYFRSENIMDDPTGGHCSVSRDQAIRMRLILNNCTGRQAWRSTFALQGR